MTKDGQLLMMLCIDDFFSLSVLCRVLVNVMEVRNDNVLMAIRQKSRTRHSSVLYNGQSSFIFDLVLSRYFSFSFVSALKEKDIW